MPFLTLFITLRRSKFQPGIFFPLVFEVLPLIFLVMQVCWWQIILSFLSSFLLKYYFCLCHFHCIWNSRLTFFLTQICLVFPEKFAVILRFVPLWVMCFFLCLLRFFFLSPILSVWLWSSFCVYLAWVLLNFLDLWIYSFYQIWKKFWPLYLHIFFLFLFSIETSVTYIIDHPILTQRLLKFVHII